MKTKNSLFIGLILYRGMFVFVSFLMATLCMVFLFTSLGKGEQEVFAEPLSIQGSAYEIRRTQLITLADQAFEDDFFRNEPPTALDNRSFGELNGMDCPKPIDDPNGWSAEFRTGGRPFLNFDVIRINGITWTTTYCTPGSSGIPQPEIDDHYATGKTVNRIWVLHRDSTGGYPIVLAFTPDGFFNPGGAFAPTKMGAALRAGFIGEPFSPTQDYLQHVDELDIYTYTDTIKFVYSIHSQVGEGVLELVLQWDGTTERPVLQFRSAHALRTNPLPPTTLMGFAGFNFMRGPTLHGLLSQSGAPEGGIEAFHDGRSAFLVHQNGSFVRDLLIPPVLTSTVIREAIADDALVGSKLVMDQPQGVSLYFSKFPDPPYEDRTDLILQVLSSTVTTMSVRKAQIAVDLSNINPEANETVNVFYASEMTPGVLAEYGYEVTLDARDFPSIYQARRQGIVFASDRSEGHLKLFFLPLDSQLLPAGPAIPLTDGVITDVAEPAASENGRFVIFDADDYGVSTRQRIYLLDLLTGDVRRLTVDIYPLENSSDWGGSLNQDNSLFSFITNRQGTNNNLRLYIGNVNEGFGTGVAIDELVGVNNADWSHTTNELAYTNYLNTFLRLYDPDSSVITDVVSGAALFTPQLSPSGERMVYGQGGNVYILNRPALTSTLVLTNAHNPIWADNTHLIVQSGFSGNEELYLLTLETGELTLLTDNLADDSEPAFVPAIGPDIEILSPQNGFEGVSPVQISGFVASSGIPTVTVNGVEATITGDHWFASIPFLPGEHLVIAQATDPHTGLTAQDEITITVHPYKRFLPAVIASD